MRREFPELHYFVRIAETRSVSRAAISLKLTQPALSRYIRNLEDEVGTRLFVRNGRGVSLTENGHRFYIHAKEALDRLELAELDVAEKFGPPLTHVTLGIVSSMTDLLVVDIAESMRRELPRVSMRVVEGFTADLVDWLNEGRVDVAVCFHEFHHASIEAMPLCEQSLYLLGGSAAEFMQPQIRFDSLAGVPLVLPAKQNLLRTQLEGIAEARGLRLNVVVEADAFATISDLVAAGLCYAIIPGGAYRSLKRSDLKISKIVEPDMTQTLVTATSLVRPQTTCGRILSRIVAAQAKTSFGLHDT
jgi:LysR family nitrogen assimilation transcriptional regulator